jgi:DNA-binding transcriptional MerR regulator
MDISEVAKRSGTSAATLRFYETRGLISSIGRQGLRRLFDASVLDRLALITRCDQLTLAREPGSYITRPSVGDIFGSVLRRSVGY